VVCATFEQYRRMGSIRVYHRLTAVPGKRLMPNAFKHNPKARSTESTKILAAAGFVLNFESEIERCPTSTQGLNNHATAGTGPPKVKINKGSLRLHSRKAPRVCVQ
jgi:hypothetical protein